MKARTPQIPTSSSHALRMLRAAISAALLRSSGSPPRPSSSSSPRGGQSSFCGRVAAAGAVERGDVLQRHEDVAVQLDVRDLVDVAIGREHALLVLAAEERDLDLLALVLPRVVLHREGQSIERSAPSSCAHVHTTQFSNGPALEAEMLRGRGASSRRA